jgi:predicted dehydrogenase
VQYKIAIIGSGYMARKHGDVLQSLPNVALHVICSTERSRENGQAHKEQYGFTYLTTDYQSVLSDSQVDVVFICSPDDTHPGYVVSALEAGKHVFCEKPLARTGEAFESIKQALNASGKILQVGMNCRFREQYSIPRARIASDEFGQLRYLRGTYIYNAVLAVHERQKPWSLSYPPGTFPFMHGGGIHCLDLLRWIGGSVNSVFARAKGFELAREWQADTFSISMEFATGAIGELLVAGAAFRPNEFSLEMWLERGSIVGTEIYRRAGDVLNPSSEKMLVEQKTIDLALQFQDMVRAIESAQQPLNSFTEAFRNFKLLTAIEQSVNESRAVDLTGG